MFRISKLSIIVVFVILLSGCNQSQIQQNEPWLGEIWELWYNFDMLFLEIAEPMIDMTREELLFNYIATEEIQEGISTLRAIADEMEKIDDEEALSIHQFNMLEQLNRLDDLLLIHYALYDMFKNDGSLENIYPFDRIQIDMTIPSRWTLDDIRGGWEFKNR